MLSYGLGGAGKLHKGMEQMSKAPQRKSVAPKGLVGRHFHIFGDDKTVSRQGKVIDQVDPTHYLVQFYDWIVGDAGTMHVYTIDAIANAASDAGERGPGAWQFYEDAAHWNDWYENHSPKNLE